MQQKYLKNLIAHAVGNQFEFSCRQAGTNKEHRARKKKIKQFVYHQLKPLRDEFLNEQRRRFSNKSKQYFYDICTYGYQTFCGLQDKPYAKKELNQLKKEIQACINNLSLKVTNGN